MPSERLRQRAAGDDGVEAPDASDVKSRGQLHVPRQSLVVDGWVEIAPESNRDRRPKKVCEELLASAARGRQVAAPHAGGAQSAGSSPPQPGAHRLYDHRRSVSPATKQ